ncbi:MAG: GNAT family N-acetyltransferase [Candidatus Thorarchaeota archaeon]
MRILEFFPKEMNDDHYESYFALRENLSREKHPDYPLPSREPFTKYMKNPDPMYDFSWWYALKDEADVVVGKGGAWWENPNSPSYDKAKHIAFIDFDFDPAYRNRANQRMFLSGLVQHMKEVGKTKLRMDSDTEENSSFFKELGGTIVQERVTNRLVLAEIDWDLMEEWKKSRDVCAPGVTIEAFINVPEKDIQEYVDIYTETTNQAPIGDLPSEMHVTPESRREMEEYWKGIGYIWTTMITRETSGSISGLTEIYYMPSAGYLVDQELTGVKKEYRGRGLGKLLKAEMLFYIKENHPDTKFITTGNANENAPMLSINHRIGFREYIKQTCFEFDMEKITTTLDL